MALASDRIAGAVAAAFIGAALLALPPAASAQQGTTPMPSQAAPAPSAAPMKAKAPAADRIETHLKKLHAQLKITADQEAKWDAVAQIMRDNAHEIDRLAGDRAAKRNGMSAVEDLSSYEAIADAHAAGLKQLVPAFATLYDTMSDTQKKNADRVFTERVRARPSRKTASHG
jgi:periplasmic protein CpxP/Spy